MTIDRWIVDAAQRDANQVAIVFAQRSITYAEFAAQITAKASTLRSLGVTHGDRVAWYGLNHPDVFVLLFACARIGAILVPLNWRLAEPEVAAIVANCTPTVLFYDSHFATQAQLLPDVLTIAQDIDADNAHVIDADNDNAHFSTSEQGRSDQSPHTVSLDEPVLLVYTSGSTGIPKGALLSQKALISNARMSVDAHRMTSDDRALVTLPLFHVGGMNILPTPAFSVGATVLLHERFEADAACLDLQHASIAITVPTVLQAMLNSQRWPTVDVTTLRGISIGSTDVPIELIQQLHTRQIPMIQIYGATETSPFAIYQTLDNAMSTVGSIGYAGIDCQIRLVMHGKDVSIGEPGEIWVKGDNVLLKYWQDAALTNEMLQDGWFRTGDVATKDNNGLYWFTDRIKHVIISGGENIYPTEIERILRTLPGVDAVTVVGIGNDQWGQIPVAVVVSQAHLQENDVLDYLQGKLARYKHPKKVVFVEALPRNAMGKVVAAEVKRLVLSILTA